MQLILIMIIRSVPCCLGSRVPSSALEAGGDFTQNLVCDLCLSEDFYTFCVLTQDSTSEQPTPERIGAEVSKHLMIMMMMVTSMMRIMQDNDVHLCCTWTIIHSLLLAGAGGYK